jgi:hypothetical protein
MNLTFPVFTPPAASSYGSTMPMRVPWEPPNLAGAINDGLKTGASLATSFLTNRKTAQEIQAEEAASKGAIAAMHDPNLRGNIGYEMGPGGFTARIISPAEAAIARANLAKTAAETEQAAAGAAEKRGETPGAQAEIEAKKAQTGKTQMETAAPNTFMQRDAAAAQTNSGMINPNAPATANTAATNNTANTTTVDYGNM